MSSAKLDPRLRYLQEQVSQERAETASSLSLAMVKMTRNVATVEVLLRCRKERGTKTLRSVEKKLLTFGFTVNAIIDGPSIVVAGTVDLDRLDELSSESFVEQVDASSRLYMDLDLSGLDIGVRTLQTVPTTVRGNNVLVGIIDSGIDFRHDDFRLADGTSRIRFLWDQSAPRVTGGVVAFGRQFTKADLDGALRTQPPPIAINHQDTNGHGTHVAGICAGNGRTSGGRFTGMAPESELIIVALRSDSASLGESNSAVAACRYIVDRANELGRPVSINMSQGMNGGGHSGETTLETALDHLARLPGIAIIKSAGNEQTWRIHAGGSIGQGATVTRKFDSSGANFQQDVMEIWFDAADQIAVAVQAPGDVTPQAGDFVSPGNTNSFQTQANNLVRIDAANVDASGTGDVRVVIFTSRGSAPRIQPGRWTLHLRGNQITNGQFHAWIERAARGPGVDEQSRFITADSDSTCTISIPGTARRIITVGSYVTRPDGTSGSGGELSRFSSHGPTRYDLQKPEIAAPGETIVSTLSAASTGEPFETGYTAMAGTSMAAPHLTGAAALILEINARFTCEQIKQILMRASRRDGVAATAPDNQWGQGKLDVRQAVELARTVRFPVISDVTISGTQISWKTDISTTGAVRFNTHQRRLTLGRALGSRALLAASQQHSLDLQGLTTGTYHCEILAFSLAPNEWTTIDDNDGNHYVVVIP